MFGGPYPMFFEFQSTLSVRRATGLRMVSRWLVQFQSTLSVRRATKGVTDNDVTRRISIHALRKESDHAMRRIIPTIRDFNPRSP